MDGFKTGWVSVALRSGAFEGARLHKTFLDVLSSFPDARVIAVDIPIGLPEGDRVRLADGAARGFLSGGGSSVFPVPPRLILEAETYSQARELAVSHWRRGVTAQSFALAKKILEVAASAEDERVFEVHPEVSFRAMKGSDLTAPKKSWNGAMERRELLHQVGIDIPNYIDHAGRAGLDDVLDAAAAAWSANRILTGTAERLPDEPELIGGHQVAIWY